MSGRRSRDGSRASVRGSASFHPASATSSRWSPGPTAALEMAILARPEPPVSRSRRSARRFDPMPTAPIPCRTPARPRPRSPPRAAIESPAVTLAGPDTRVTARSGAGLRPNIRMAVRARMSAGISAASSISPSVATTIGRSDAEAARSAGASSDRPREGAVSATLAHRRSADIPPPRRRVSRFRPPSAGGSHAEGGVEENEGPERSAGHRAAHIEDKKSQCRPGNGPADHRRPAAYSGALEMEIGVCRQRPGGENYEEAAHRAASRASGRSNRPSYSARPTMAPASPASHTARRSSRLETPPLAMTRAPAC